MLAWDPSLAIGVPEIDEQHRTIFAEAARFDAAVRAGVQGREIQELFDFLSRYAREHFEAEEQLMREVGYPRLASHALEHAETVQEFPLALDTDNIGFLRRADV